MRPSALRCSPAIWPTRSSGRMARPFRSFADRDLVLVDKLARRYKLNPLEVLTLGPKELRTLMEVARAGSRAEAAEIDKAKRSKR